MLMIRPRVVKKITNHLDPAAEIKKDPDPFVYIDKIIKLLLPNYSNNHF